MEGFELVFGFLGLMRFVRWVFGSVGFFGLLLGVVGCFAGRCCGPCLVLKWWLLLDFSFLLLFWVSSNFMFYN